MQADRDRIAELEERVTLLRSLLVDMNVQPPFEWKLSASETLVFGAMVNREGCSIEHLMSVVEDRLGDKTQDLRQSVHVILVTLRRKLGQNGIRINKSGNAVYGLSPEVRAKYRTPRRARLDEFLRSET